MANVDFLFKKPTEFNEKTVRKKWKENTPEILEYYSNELNGLGKFEASAIEAHFQSFLENNELGMGALMPNLRLAFTGLGSGPSLYHIMEILGKEECQARINEGILKLA